MQQRCLQFEKMKSCILNFLIIAALSLTVCSCASFSKKKFRNEIEKLEETNVSKLNGNYSFHPIKRFYSLDKENPNDKIPDSLKHNNAYQFLVNESFKKKTEFDSFIKSEHDYYVTLNFENKTRLRIKAYENSKVIKDTTLTGKYKNGMFYLDNKFLECSGIPYLFGGCRNNKRRIGLTKRGNLIINEAVNNGGALLFIIGSGYNYNLAFEYQRK